MRKVCVSELWLLAMFVYSTVPLCVCVTLKLWRFNGNLYNIIHVHLEGFLPLQPK